MTVEKEVVQDHVAVWVTLVLTRDCAVELVEVGGESSSASASSRCGPPGGSLPAHAQPTDDTIRPISISMRKPAHTYPLYEPGNFVSQHLVPRGGLLQCTDGAVAREGQNGGRRRGLVPPLELYLSPRELSFEFRDASQGLGTRCTLAIAFFA